MIMRKIIATIRGPNTLHQCPYGLEISISCQSVGEAIYKMEPLDEVPLEQLKKYVQANRKVYRHEMTGDRCPYSDKIPLNRNDLVNCDYGDQGAGEREWPMPQNSSYPRMFSGVGQAGLYAYPIGAYTDYPGTLQTVSPGIYSTFSQFSNTNMQKISNGSDMNSDLYYEFNDSILVDKPCGG